MENKASSSKDDDSAAGNIPTTSGTSGSSVTASGTTGSTYSRRDTANKSTASPSATAVNVGPSTSSGGNYMETVKRIKNVLSAMEARFPILVARMSDQKQQKLPEDEEEPSIPSCELSVDSDLAFVYEDTDTFRDEIAEWYSFSEKPEFHINFSCFEIKMMEFEMPRTWRSQNSEQRISVIMKLVNQLTITDKSRRMICARCLLYIAQGCWGELQTEAEQREYETSNAMLLYQLGAFNAFINLLNTEIQIDFGNRPPVATSLADSMNLRVILSIIYTITEVMRQAKDSGSSEFKNSVDAFLANLANPPDDELLTVKLFQMVERFWRGTAPHFPIKKILLLLWKLMLMTLGGMYALQNLKRERRLKEGLPPFEEDTIQIAGRMKSSELSGSTADVLDESNARPSSQDLTKRSNTDSVEIGADSSSSGNTSNTTGQSHEYDEGRPSEENPDGGESSGPVSPTSRNFVGIAKSSPWKLKARQRDLDSFLNAARIKHLGYTLPGDSDPLRGLPLHIKGTVETLKENIYTSLAELQIHKERDTSCNPLAWDFQEDIEMTPTEVLYQTLLPNLTQYLEAFMDILSAASPVSLCSYSFNILADVFPYEMRRTREIGNSRLRGDSNRHQELIVKAISAILLLLLKHFKLNHIYQFEYLTRQLTSVDCITQILRFFNQDIMDYVRPKNVTPLLDFPSFVLDGSHQFNSPSESSPVADPAPLSWRNMFSCINLLRILNKLTKRKDSRIMMMVTLESASPLKRILAIRHPITQLYALKLIKMQSRFLGPQWREQNIKIVNAIYQKLRHRFNDDWAHGNGKTIQPSTLSNTDESSKLTDRQTNDEDALITSVQLFNKRRYTQRNDQFEFLEDYSVTTILEASCDLPDTFTQHYAQWVHQKLAANSTEWDFLLDD